MRVTPAASVWVRVREKAAIIRIRSSRRGISTRENRSMPVSTPLYTTASVPPRNTMNQKIGLQAEVMKPVKYPSAMAASAPPER